MKNSDSPPTEAVTTAFQLTKDPLKYGQNNNQTHIWKFVAFNPYNHIRKKYKSYCLDKLTSLR